MKGVARSLNLSFTLLALMVVLVSLSTSLNAQPIARPPSPTVPAGGARTNEITDPPSIQERQYLMRSMEIEANRARFTPEQKRLALAQIADDYTQIQIINNKMMAAAMSAAQPNYAKIVESIAEIGKRASRIKTNLPLPDDDKKNSGEKPFEYKTANEPAGIKASLLLLDARIMSFVNNPIFQNTSVVEVGEAARAKADLKRILEFTDRLAKDAKKLQKSADK